MRRAWSKNVGRRTVRRHARSARIAQEKIRNPACVRCVKGGRVARPAVLKSSSYEDACALNVAGVGWERGKACSAGALASSRRRALRALLCAL
jgi:hypothetical protein